MKACLWITFQYKIQNYKLNALKFLILHQEVTEQEKLSCDDVEYSYGYRPMRELLPYFKRRQDRKKNYKPKNMCGKGESAM